MANETRRATGVFSTMGNSVLQTNGRPLTREQIEALENLTPNLQVTLCDNLRNDRQEAKLLCRVFRIGRDPECKPGFKTRLMPEVAATVRRSEGKWELTAHVANRVKIGGTFVGLDETVPLERQVKVEITPAFEVYLNFLASKEEECAERVERLDEQLNVFAGRVHKELLERKGNDEKFVDADFNHVDDDVVFGVELSLDEIAQAFGLYDDERKDLLQFMAGKSVEDQIVSSLLGDQSREQEDEFAAIFGDKFKHYSRLATAQPSFEKKLQEVGAQILRRNLQISEIPDEDSPDYDSFLTRAFDKVEKSFWGQWFKIVKSGKGDEFIRYLASRYLKKTLKDVLFGYGPLEDLLRTPIISEIMVVDYKTIYIEKKGRLEKSGRRFLSEETTQDVINRIVQRVNRQIDKSRPLVDARLADGSRVNAIIDPIAVSGACLTIRRFPKKRLSVRELVENPKIRSLSHSAAEFLRASILARKNILVSGGTGTGKTTLLNCLCDYIPDGERIVTIEDTVELRIAKQHVVRLEAKPANAEGKGAYTIRDLVKNALRMRPDRIIVGECRGGEALDMLQAMNTGHDGSLTTIHANNAMDAILRLETLVLQSDAKMPVESIDRQIASAIDLIVQLRRMRSGRRCVSQIVEVTHLDPETGEFVLREIFNLESETDDSAILRPTGSLPSYMDVLLARKWLDLEKFYFDGQGRK